MLRSQKYKDQSEGVQLNMVVTPMLDMSFQILFFFVFMYVLAPKEIREGKMDFNLPAHGERKAHNKADEDPNKPSDVELALPANLTVVIKSDATGNRVAEGEVGAAQVFATIYKALGISPSKNYYVGARPVPLTEPGTKAIEDVLA